MRLGIVMMGVGAYAAANVGVLQELLKRQIEPFAVCGLQAGAWPAALYACGMDEKEMIACVCHAEQLAARLLSPACSWSSVLKRRSSAVLDGRRIEKLLIAQVGQRPLALCKKPAMFICRAPGIGQRLVMTTVSYPQEAGVMQTTQMSVSFAARAAMSFPPFLSSARFMGSPLIAERDAFAACRQLFALGAQRVLLVSPFSAPADSWDALNLTACAMGCFDECAAQDRVGILRIRMPADTGALSAEKMSACREAGRRAAEAELDCIFSRMGMAFCRVLPFKRSI